MNRFIVSKEIYLKIILGLLKSPVIKLRKNGSEAQAPVRKGLKVVLFRWQKN